ncbi:hypothetical protein H1C71_032585, partial [Ictidomys tridecemlineatus]
TLSPPYRHCFGRAQDKSCACYNKSPLLKPLECGRAQPTHCCPPLDLLLLADSTQSLTPKPPPQQCPGHLLWQRLPSEHPPDGDKLQSLQTWPPPQRMLEESPATS